MFLVFTSKNRDKIQALLCSWGIKNSQMSNKIKIYKVKIFIYILIIKIIISQKSITEKKQEKHNGKLT